jgi:ABC-type lipoprotein release transport system permease subunit
VLSALVGRYLAAQIYGLPAWDVKAAVSTALVLVLAAIAAGWLPARRAARLPLAGALRTE